MNGMYVRQLIDYDYKTGKIERRDGKLFVFYIKNNSAYTCMGGRNLHVLQMIWAYMYGEVEKSTRIYTLTENRTDFRLFNLICPGKPNSIAASKISRYFNRLDRQTITYKDRKSFNDFNVTLDT